MARFEGRYPTSYTQASAMLGKRQEKTLDGKATTLRRDSENEVSVRYHFTDIVTFQANGEIILRNGGHATKTTKDKINSCLVDGWHVVAIARSWYLGRKGEIYNFAWDMQIAPDGTVSHIKTGETVPAVRVTSLTPSQIPAPLRA